MLSSCLFTDDGQRVLPLGFLFVVCEMTDDTESGSPFWTPGSLISRFPGWLGICSMVFWFFYPVPQSVMGMADGERDEES